MLLHNAEIAAVFAFVAARNSLSSASGRAKIFDRVRNGMPSRQIIKGKNMLNLELPFRLTIKTPAPFFGNHRPQSRRTQSTQVTLEGLSIAIKAGQRVYEISSV